MLVVMHMVFIVGHGSGLSRGNLVHFGLGVHDSFGRDMDFQRENLSTAGSKALTGCNMRNLVGTVLFFSPPPPSPSPAQAHRP